MKNRGIYVCDPKNPVGKHCRVFQFRDESLPFLGKEAGVREFRSQEFRSQEHPTGRTREGFEKKLLLGGPTSSFREVRNSGEQESLCSSVLEQLSGVPGLHALKMGDEVAKERALP